jgi:hypothetical protein
MPQPDIVDITEVVETQETLARFRCLPQAR